MIADQIEVLGSQPAARARRGLAQQGWTSLWAAVQFLTQIPTPTLAWDEATLVRALAFFPGVGLALGAAAGGINLLLLPHLPRSITALLTVALLVLVTGGLHEDGLADCADAFGSRHTKERTLAILHDSRIGAYGALALILSVGARILLIAALPAGRILPVLIAAVTLSRWSILPLAFLPSASPGSGQGTSIAGRISALIFTVGTAFAMAVTGCALRLEAIPTIFAASLVVSLSAAFYRRRIGGVTGDCFGATVQMVEIAVLLCGVWTR
jgi:adenosylcobinamide-GDP ribazoletransferase